MKSITAPKSLHAITKIEVTPDSLTGRAGLNLFVQYLDSICIQPLLQHLFGRLRKSSKGLPIVDISNRFSSSCSMERVVTSTTSMR